GIDVPAIVDLQTQLDDARVAVVLRRGQLRGHIHMRGGLIHPGCGHDGCEQQSQQQAGRNQLAVFHTGLSPSAWLMARVNASAENRPENVLIRSPSALSTAAKGSPAPPCSVSSCCNRSCGRVRSACSVIMSAARTARATSESSYTVRSSTLQLMHQSAVYSTSIGRLTLCAWCQLAAVSGCHASDACAAGVNRPAAYTNTIPARAQAGPTARAALPGD